MAERCEKCNPEFCTYPEHVYYASASNTRILGSKDSLCEGIYHVFPAPEFNIAKHGSLSGREHDNCRPYAMTMVAMCGGLIGRFTNCNRKHAEEFLVSDSRMFHHIRTFKPKSMVLFMKHHPCHHSSGNTRRYPNGYLFNGHADLKSCTMQIIRYFREVLQPNGVNLLIKVAWLYKAFWLHAVREDDKQTSLNSLKGLELMLEAGIQFSEMKPYDWITLANMCSEPIDLSSLLSHSRLAVDRGIGAFLQKVKIRQTHNEVTQIEENIGLKSTSIMTKIITKRERNMSYNQEEEQEQEILPDHAVQTPKKIQIVFPTGHKKALLIHSRKDFS